MKTLSDYLHKIERVEYPIETKKTLVEYMKKRKFLEWASTKKITDPITKEMVETVCFVGYSDDVYEWTSSETYLLEKYDLKISDEFINHVLARNKLPAHADT